MDGIQAFARGRTDVMVGWRVCVLDDEDGVSYREGEVVRVETVESNGIPVEYMTVRLGRVVVKGREISVGTGAEVLIDTSIPTSSVRVAVPGQGRLRQ